MALDNDEFNGSSYGNFWSQYNSHKISLVETAGGELRIEVPTQEATDPWYNNEEGYLLYQTHVGEVDISTKCRVRNIPGTAYSPESYVFGGIIIYNPVTDDYVFVVTGNRGGHPYAVEVKKTINGTSRVRGYTISAPESQLRLVREADGTVRVFSKAYNASAGTPWTERALPAYGGDPDLGNVNTDTVWIGVIAYAFSNYGQGFSAYFDYFRSEGSSGPSLSIDSFNATPSTILEGSGTPVTLAWETTSATSVSIDQGVGSVPVDGNTVVTPNSTTTYTLTASDGQSNIQDSVTVTVNPANVAPNADAGPDQSENEGNVVSLDGTGSNDPDGIPAPITYSWTQISGPTVTLSNSSVAQPTFTAPQVTGSAVLVFELTVDDSELSDSDQVSITINDAPTVITIDDQDSEASVISGSWPNAGGASNHHNGSSRYATVGSTVDTFRFTPSLSAGDYQVEVWNTTYQPRATVVPHTINHAGGSTTVNVDQHNLQNQWVTLGIFTFNAGTSGYIEITDSGASGGPYIGADAARFTLVGSGPSNQAPISNAGVDQSVIESVVVQLDGSASNDPDSGPSPLTFSWTQTSGPSMTLSDSSIASPSFTATTPGIYIFELEVSDSDLSDTDSVTITVNANQSPSASAGPDQTVLEGVVVNLDGTASSDSDGGPSALSFSWSQVSGPSVTLNNAATSNPSFTSPDVSGIEILVFELQVFDGLANSTDQVQITVDSSNQAPVANAGVDQTVIESMGVILDGSASNDPDAGPSPLTYSWTQTSGPSVTLSDSSSATPSFTAVLPGFYTFQLEVSDSELNDTDTVDITVNANSSPIADAGIDQSVSESSSVTLDGSGSSDPDSGPSSLTYSWTQISGPSVTLNNANQSQADFNAPNVSSSTDLVFQLEVQDGLANDIDTITVTINDAPVEIVLDNGDAGTGSVSGSWYNASAASNHYGANSRYAVVGSSIDTYRFTPTLTAGDYKVEVWNATYHPRATSVPNIVTHAGGSTTVLVDQHNQHNQWVDLGTFAFNAGTSGYVEITDNGASGGPYIGADAARFTLVGGASNQAPSADAGADQSVIESVVVQLDGSASSDPDSGPSPLTYSWTQDSGPVVTINNPDSSTPDFVAASPGAYAFSLEVSDGDLQDTDSVSITVNSNQIPLVDAGLDQNVVEGVVVNLDASGSSDPDTGPSALTYSWSQISGPSATLSDSSSATPSFTAPDVSSQQVLVFEVTVNDGLANDSDQVSITVDSSNQAPVANAGADQSVFESSVVNLDGSGSNDPDSGPAPLTYSWTQTSGPSVSLSDSSIASPSFTATLPGTYVFSLEVSDSELNDSDPVTITVNANQAPSANAGANQSVLEGVVVNLDASASSDPDAGPSALTYSWSQISGPSVTLSNASSATPSFTSLDVTGIEVLIFEVTVNDGLANDSDQVSITVDSSNQAPVANAGADQSVIESSVVNLNGSASSDPDSGPAPLTYSWTQTSGPSVSLSDSSIASPSFTATLPGTYVFSLEVSDSELNDSDSVTITVNANQAPSANAGANQSVLEGVVVNLDASGSSDPDAGPSALTYSWSQISGPSVTLSDASSATPSFTSPDVTGIEVLIFEVTVNDGLANDSDQVSITVDSSNQSPVANAGTDQSVFESSVVNLDGSGSNDPDSGPAPLTYSWTQTSGPSVSLSDSSVVSPSFTATLPGTYVFSLEVSDSELNDSDSVAITVNENQVPSANAGADQSVLEGVVVNLDASASSDPDAGPSALTYSWSQISGPSATLSDVSSATPSFTAPDVSSQQVLVFEVTVNDGLANDSDQVSITVDSSNQAPVANAGADQSVFESSVVNLNGSASSDPDSGPAPLTYSWTQTSGPSVSLSDSSVVSPSFTAILPGTYIFSLEVSDSELNDSDSVTITVNANQAPSANAGADQNVIEGAAVTLDGTGSSDPDAGPSPLTYTWTQISGPSVSLSNASQASANFTAPSVGGATNLVFQVEVNDGLASSTDQVTVTVQDGAIVIILDNGDAGTSVPVGYFNNASAATNHYGPNSRYASTNRNATYRFTPTITTAGTYKVEVWNATYHPRATSVPNTVTHDGGSTTVYVNQDTQDNQWVDLGNYTFTVGTDGYVEISTIGASGGPYIGADAARFTLIQE